MRAIRQYSSESASCKVKVSIITVVYNGAATIRDTIESVLGQDYAEVEYIVIDGASRDATVEIVRSYGDRISCFISEPDAGIYDAMNKGIVRATGEVIGLLNADDVYDTTGVLSQVMQKFRTEATDAVYGDLLYVDGQDPSIVRRTWRAGTYRKGQFLAGWMPPHPTFFIRQTWYEKHGGFRLDMGTAADYELMLRMAHKHGAKLSYVQNVLVHMRTGGASNRSMKSRLLANRNDRKAWMVNGLRPHPWTIVMKPLRKILQFFK